MGLIQSTKAPKDAGLYCGPRLRKGEVFAYVGLPQNLKDLKDLKNLKDLKDSHHTEAGASISDFTGVPRTQENVTS